MASELATGMRDVAQGVYLVPQFHRFDLSAEIVEAARKG
jgi:hypothetical protein